MSERKGLTEAQFHDLANALAIGWKKYTELLGEPPHGTTKQLLAMLELSPLETVFDGIKNRAVACWYADGQQ